MSTPSLSSFVERAGLQIIEASAERALAQIKITHDVCNRANNVAGGLIMAIADELGTTLLASNLPDGAHSTTIDSNTNFIAPIHEGDVAYVECKIVFSEPKRIVWEAKVTFADGRLAAVVSQTQLIDQSIAYEI